MLVKEMIKRFIVHAGFKPGIFKQFIYHNPYVQQKNLLPDPKVIFDIGAYDGRTAKKYNKLFPSAKIFSFEPYHKSIRRYRNNLKRIPQATVYEFTVSDKSDLCILNVNQSHATNSLLKSNNQAIWFSKSMQPKKEVLINTITLEEFCKKKNIQQIDILKIDVQGGELMVLMVQKTYFEIIG